MKAKNIIIIGLLLSLLLPGLSAGNELSLFDALKYAMNKSSQSEIIRGDLAVAQQKYDAERINFYVPEISINGRLPFYRVSESFDNLYGNPDKTLNRRTNLNFDADITLKQSLITGGDLTIKGNLYNRTSDYPRYRVFTDEIFEISQEDKQSQFDFNLSQPLLKPSAPKNELKNKKDDLFIAELSEVEETTKLKKDVIFAYFGMLQIQIEHEISSHKAESAKLSAGIDSIKFNDGIMSEEAWLESSSSRLDSELDLYDKENDKIEKKRDLAIILDIESSDPIEISVPVMPEHLSENQKQFYTKQWENSVPVLKAATQFKKSDRQANFQASNSGLTGTLDANYSVQRGDITVDDISNENNTDSWGLTVNFTLPLWDGGSSGASNKAARLSVKKFEIELQRAKKTAQANIINLINKLDISYRKISVMLKQVDLAKNKLDIAMYREKDGQISKIEMLSSQVFYKEAQNRYMEELKNYFLTKFDLEGMYL